MSLLAGAWLALLAAFPPQRAEPPGTPAENCSVCHGAEHVQLAAGVHASATCTSCHGGDPQASEAAAAHGEGFRALTEPQVSVAACGACHADVQRMMLSGLRTDQLALYRASRHGQRLFEAGDEQVATCTDCHGAHLVLSASDPASAVHARNQAETCGRCHSDAELMGGYGLSADASELYAASVHGIATAAGLPASPACSDCHGAHGALPPRVEEVQGVCGQCHSAVRDYFQGGAHGAASNEVQCATCHGYHDVARLDEHSFVAQTGSGSCSSCHQEDEQALAVARSFKRDLDGLEARLHEVSESIAAAGRRGLYLDEEASFVADARGVLARARSATHSVSTEELDALLDRGRGLIRQTEDTLATRARTDRDRRIFTALFFALTLALGAMLWMYSREFTATSGAQQRAGDEA